MISCLTNLSFDVTGISGHNSTVELQSSWESGPPRLATVRHKACNPSTGIVSQYVPYQSMPISFSVFTQFILKERGPVTQNQVFFKSNLILLKSFFSKLKTSIEGVPARFNLKA